MREFNLDDSGANMMTAEQNYRLLQEIEANRQFLLTAYQQNPRLLERAEPRIREIFEVPERREHSANAVPRTPTINLQRGISLIELIMFIVIISIAVAGILLVMNKVIGHSADTLVRKQALAIADSFLEEIQLQDMSGVNVSSGSANADRRTFDNVFNYHNYSTTGGFKTMDGTTVVLGLSGYNVASVQVIPIPTALGNIPALSASAVMITVTVSDPNNQTLAVTGYRAGN